MGKIGWLVKPIVWIWILIKIFLIYPLFRWFVRRFVKRIRFWNKSEWNKYTEKEKFWIWYKHHQYLKGSGSAEVDQIVMPLKELVLYGGIILSNISLALIYLGLKLDYFVILTFVVIGCVILWILNFAVQWKLGNWKDDKDLNALENEIANRRNLFVREMRKMAMKADFRKNL